MLHFLGNLLDGSLSDTKGRRHHEEQHKEKKQFRENLLRKKENHTGAVALVSFQ